MPEDEARIKVAILSFMVAPPRSEAAKVRVIQLCESQLLNFQNRPHYGVAKD